MYDDCYDSLLFIVAAIPVFLLSIFFMYMLMTPADKDNNSYYVASQYVMDKVGNSWEYKMDTKGYQKLKFCNPDYENFYLRNQAGILGYL